jgi:hypothetical protein
MPETIWYTVTTEFNGKPITGSYSVNKETVTVRLAARFQDRADVVFFGRSDGEDDTAHVSEKCRAKKV